MCSFKGMQGSGPTHWVLRALHCDHDSGGPGAHQREGLEGECGWLFRPWSYSAMWQVGLSLSHADHTRRARGGWMCWSRRPLCLLVSIPHFSFSDGSSSPCTFQAPLLQQLCSDGSTWEPRYQQSRGLGHFGGVAASEGWVPSPCLCPLRTTRLCAHVVDRGHVLALWPCLL